MKHDSDILKRIKSYFMRRRSAEEAHAFEREVERDPFLYEAMEGYEDMLTSDIQQALDELDDRLDEKSKRSGFIFTWQAAAVGGVVVIGAALAALLSQGPTADPQDVATEEQRSYEPRVVTTDFNTLEDVDAAYALEEVGEDIPTVIDDPEEGPEPEVLSGADRDKLEEAESRELATEASPNAMEQETLQQEATQSNATSEQADIAVIEHAKEGEPVGSTLSAPTSRKSVQMASEADQLQSMDEEATAAPVATPEGGMESYQRYLRQNLQRSDDMPIGSVVVTFEFDRDGSPRKIDVAKSLCTACDAEAIRLIENGPKWNTENRRERVTVVVPFEP